MTGFRMYNLIIFTILFLLNSIAYSARTIIGDNTTNGFSFAIKQHAFRATFDNFIFSVAADVAKVDNAYAVAITGRGFDNFKGLTPKIVKLNGIEKQNNPLNGAKISLLEHFQESPVVVKEGENKKVYLIHDTNNISVISSTNLNDAKSNESAGIVKLGVANLSSKLDSFIFAAVKNNKGDVFGSEGSGISLLKFNVREVKEKINNEEKKKVIQELIIISPESKTPNKAFQFDGSISAIKIKENASIVSDIIDMHWDEHSNRLFIALQVKSNNGGARAVVVGRIFDGNLIFSPIASDNVFSGNANIVGTNDQEQFVSIYKIRTMYTSTKLNYLIVAGGNGPITAVGNSIYALPIVNGKNNEEARGTLAKYDQIPKDEYIKEYFTGRSFTQPATNSNDLLNSNDDAANVGNGPLPLNSNQLISDMFVLGDTVFVSIANDYENSSQPGIFSSQAIFDNKGAIKSWTNWSRIIGTDSKIFGICFDYFTSQFWYVCENSLKRTEWGKGENKSKGNGLLGGTISDKNVGLVNILNEKFPKSIGGIQNLFDFNKNTCGFNNFSIMIAVGLKQIMLIETGRLQDGFFKPNKGNFLHGAALSIKGDYPIVNSETRIVNMMGGILNELHSIISSEIVSDKFNDKHWIAVAGVGGLAILMDSNGNGWNGNISAFTDIPRGLAFKKIGDFSFVKKIKSDGKFLYVLTDKKLDRIEISNENFKNANLKIETIADFKALGLKKDSSFSDFNVSDKLALLATSDGLFRIGNGRDVRIGKSNELNWTLISVPESIGPVYKLLFVTKNNNESDFAFKSQLYVLSGFKGLQQSRVNRFIVDLIGEINDNTILPLPDFHIKDFPGYLFDFAGFRDNFSNQISLNFNISSSKSFARMAPGIKSGSKSVATMLFNLPNLNEATRINPIVINSASGSLLLSGNFGIQVNE